MHVYNCFVHLICSTGHFIAVHPHIYRYPSIFFISEHGKFNLRGENWKITMKLDTQAIVGSAEAVTVHSARRYKFVRM